MTSSKIAALVDSLNAGRIILGGRSFTHLLRVYKGDTVHADYVPLGGVTGRFE